MPSIFKSFLKPNLSEFVLPKAEELEVNDTPEEVPVPEEPVPEQDSSEVEESPSEKRTPIDYAKIQAEEILADARRRGEEEAEALRQAAQAEIEALKAEAQADGYREGYAEGLTQARLDTEAKFVQEAQERGRQVQAFLEKATLARDEMLVQTRSELRDLSIAVAEKVIHISLKSSGEVIARMIQVATEKLKRREWVHIYIAGCDAKTPSQIAPELMTALAGLSDHVKIIPMADDESGTCIIEMPDEIIDASVSTQISNIKDILSES